ncbi:MAG TPA: D-2-hydroxyacid dehydrogenase [Candidatus Solibacter sp.]|jgi:phosphoglycerate dehydrogenase-like enzyme|nr:D-2-hydroxyacid dehydrogenase [Candidatus Solibacter sp.]
MLPSPLMKVLIAYHHPFEPWRAAPWAASRLQSDFPQLEVVQLTSDDLDTRQVADLDVLITCSMTPQQFLAAPSLKWIHAPTAAVHELLFPELIDSGVVVTNSGEVHGPLVAEHAITLLLALAKRIPQSVRHQQKREWAQQELWDGHPRPREVAGATAVVVGMGSIGREFTARARALGLRVVAVRKDPAKGAHGADAVYPATHLDEVLPEADFVLLCAPLTSATAGLMDGPRLARMKRDAYLINVGRGTLVDERALIEALGNRAIGGAALDVFAEEPLPPSSPLWSMENLLITPHNGASINGLWERHHRLIQENMARFLSGRPLLNQVNKHRGY